MPGEIIEHQAHAIGHAAVLLADRGVLLAGDMLSDVLIPLLDPRRTDQVGAYESALDRLDEAARHVEVVVPGHAPPPAGPPASRSTRPAAGRTNHVEQARPPDVHAAPSRLLTGLPRQSEPLRAD